MLDDNNNDNSEIEIDQNDLIIIRDTQNWKPTKKFIVAYANQLGFDVDNDPPELLSIAEKYLTKDIPEYFLRAFHKDTLQILYINILTNEIELSSEYEDLAKKEYKELKEKYYKDMKSKEILANSKVTVVPRKKIAPIGAKKLLEDPKKQKEKEFMKKIEKTFKESVKENQYEDDETRQLKATIKKGEKASLFLNDNNDENIQSKYRNNDYEDIEKKSDDDIDYDQKHEINSRERKFPSKNQIRNSNNNNNNNQRNDFNNLNNLNNNNDDNKGNLRLILTDSNDNNENTNDRNNQFREITLSDDEQAYNGPISSKNNYNNNQNLNEENNSDKEQYLNSKYNNNKNNSNQNNEINIINNQNSLKADNDDNSSPRIQRSNVRHKNISKNYRYDQKKIEEINNEVGNRKDSEDNNNAYNNNNNSNINIKINDGNEDSVDYGEQKKKYLVQTKQKLNKYKKGLIDSYVKKKKKFIDNYINNLSSKKNKDLRNKINEEKDEISQKLLEYEKELKNKMKKETEKYKEELESEYEDNNIILTEGNFDDIKKNLELKTLQKESEIRIQKNKNSKLSQNKIYDKNKKLNNLSKELENKKSELDVKTQDKINKITREYENNFKSYTTQIEFNYNNRKKDNYDNIAMNKKEELRKYEQELASNLEEKKKVIQKEYENKFNLEIEKFKNTAKVENTNNFSDDNLKIEEEYYNDINELKMINKEINNKLDEKIKNILEKAYILSEKIKSKELKEINELLSQFKQNINRIKQEENNNNDDLIDDYISELYSNKQLILNKYSSQVDMTEDEYKKIDIFLQYYIDIIKTIINLLYEYNSKNNNNKISDRNANEEIIIDIENNIRIIIEKYKNKYINEKNNRLYEFLYNSLKKLMDAIFSDENTNNIINNSIYGRSFINNNLHNISQNMTNANSLNNSVSNRSNINNMLRSARIFPNNNNLINISNLNDISNNDISNAQNFYNTQRQNQNQNPNQRIISPSISPEKGNPRPTVLNKTFSSSFRSRYNNMNNMQSINEEVEPNTNRIDEDDINVPQLPSDIVNSLTVENMSNYKIIADFLIDESKNFLREQNLYYQKMEENSKLNSLGQNGELAQYQGVLERIRKQENSKMNQCLKDIQTKSNLFEIIKHNCEENFNFIMKYYNKPNFVSNKLRVLVTHIQDYKSNFYSQKAQNENIFSKNNNVEHLLNNTFSINNRSNNFNNSQNIFNNTMNYNFRNNII